ncbi:MAG TPA: response regulator [Bacteroidia bacterium]|nr:response regulator [Bacteroidia bacterium]HRD38206.1 response regulator [Bacteroidia bacterium]
MGKIKKILLAEDELLIAKVLRMQLEKKGFEVNSVTSAPDAESLASTWHPDLIILDVHLKNHTSGIEAGFNIRNSGVDCPIIFTTGNSYESTLKEIENIKNVELLSKPVEFEYLMTFIHK